MVQILFWLGFLSVPVYSAYFQLRSESTAAVQDADVILLGDIHETLENHEQGVVTPEQQKRDSQAEWFIQTLPRDSNYTVLIEGRSGPLRYESGFGLSPQVAELAEFYGWDMVNLNNASYLLYSSYPRLNESQRAVVLWQIQLLGFVRSYFMGRKILDLRAQFPERKIIVLAGSLHILDGVAENLLRKNRIKYASLLSPDSTKGGALRMQLENFLRMGGISESQIPAYFLKVDRAADEFIKQAPRLPGWPHSPDDALYLKHCEDCWCHLRSLGKTEYLPH